MQIRKLSLAVCLCVLACMVASAQPQSTPPGTGYVVELPGGASSGFEFQGYLYNGTSLTRSFDANGPANATTMLALPSGSKYYMLGAGAGGLQSVDPTFTTFKAINGITGVTCTAALTTDGKYLFVGAANTCSASASSALYIIDTSTDAVVPNSVSLTGAILGFAMSQDSKTAYMLTNGPFNSTVTAIDVGTRTQSAQVVLPAGAAVSISISPIGLVYVAVQNEVFEITPNAASGSQCDNTFEEVPPLCVTPTGQIKNILAVPGPMHFTPAGDYLYLVNTNLAVGGRSVFQINLLNKTVASWPPPASGNAPLFTDVYVAGENEVFAVSAADTKLWDITTAPLGAQQSSILATALPVSSVLSIALSNELPSARYLFALVSVQNNFPNLYRVDLTNNTVTSRVGTSVNPGILQFVQVPPNSGAASFYVFNNNQNLTPGATSLPLNAFVLDATGRPINGQHVTYAPADPNSGIVINGATPASNANGFITATATMPGNAKPGAYTVNVTAGNATQAFTLTIPGNGGGGGGGGNGPAQVTIVGGNGMLMASFFSVPQPLTILVTDTNGNPLPNQAVSFTPVSGCGSTDVGPATVSPTNTFTDENGLATAIIFPQQPINFHAFQVTDINASTPVGAVDFCETTFSFVNGLGAPEVTMLAPTQGAPINMGEGDTLSNAIQASVVATAIPDIGTLIPNIGIRIAPSLNPLDTTPPPASCVGNTLSDQTGIAHCTLVASCVQGTTSAVAVIGEAYNFPFVINIGPGSGRKITLSSGDGQTGNAGSTLSLPLIAHVSDNCGKSAPNLNVTWQVTKGSATLKSTISSSDTSGNVSTLVQLGQTPGAVQVSVTLGANPPVLFNLTSRAVVAGINLISGGGQSVVVNSDFPQPLVFEVDDTNGHPVPGITVNFAITAGIGALKTQSAVTDSTTGQVSTKVTAGATPGTITVTATYSTFSASTALNVTPAGPIVSAKSFFDAATVGTSNARTGIVPCGLNSLVALGIAANVQGVVLGNPLGLGPLPYTLQGFSMTINNVPVPLLSISNVNGSQQVNFQTPCETQPGVASAVITINGNNTQVLGIQVLPALPGIINYAGPNNLPLGFVISAADGTYVTPSNPAKTNNTYYLVLTGLGQTTPPITTNAAGTGSQTIPLSNLIVGLNNAGIPVTLAEYAAGQTGVYVIGFHIPAGAPTGPNQPLTVAILENGSYVFANPVYLPNVVAGN